MLASVKASLAAVKTAMASRAGRRRPGQAALVGHQHRVAHGSARARRRQARQQQVGIRELRDGPWRDEAGGLDLAQAGRHEQLDEVALDVRGDRHRLVLEAVARADLVDADVAGQGHRRSG